MPQLDLLGHLIRSTPHFRGKPQLIQFWLKHRDISFTKSRFLPGGKTVQCDFAIPYEAMVWLRHEEQEDLEILLRLLKPGQTFVDCGANIGLWSITATSVIGDYGHIYAFEPNPKTVNKLRLHASDGGINNIQIYPFAVGERNKEVFFKCETAHNISGVVGESTMDAVLVKQVRLDDILKDTPVNGCKIDVEGHELEVLKGARNMLEISRPWLCVEFNTLMTGNNRLGDWEVHSFLRSAGYEAYPFNLALNHSHTDRLKDDWRTQGYCNLFYTAD